jgi:hypothetical protein
MKHILFSTLIIFLFNSCNTKSTSYTDEIKLFQYHLNTEFSDAATSPLTAEDIPIFKALEFFEIDEQYRIIANFEITPDTPVFEMQTTTERLPLYRKYGIARFKLNGADFELSLYQNQEYITSPEYGHLLFLPYNDNTNGKLTYGGGRFIDVEIPDANSKTIVIDFNKSYNPLCAYNHKFSCPIPPSENNLNIEIKAGVKAYKIH